jgi:glutamate-1-semialdehyde 2,1-aminomutase
MNIDRSIKAAKEALAVIPGGVNSPVRAFRSVGGDPIFFERGKGSRLWDIDGNEYIDYVGSWGPAILGHAHSEVVDAVKKSLDKGFSFGAPTVGETTLVHKVQEFFPSMEKIRLVSSGTEACMSVLRVARAFTKRDKILKFTGCYHGHADMLLVKAGSGALTLGLPDSPGVPADATKHTLLGQYNDVEGLKNVFSEHPDQIAAIILEPIVGNAGFIRPSREFLLTMETLCKKHGTLLVFDEVMTGFRVATGGAQQLFGMKPDLTTLGKVIGGGMPIGAYGGRLDVMAMVAPEGPVYQAGTLSGNPVAVACGLKTLEILQRKGIFSALTEKTKMLMDGMVKIAKASNIPLVADCEGGMFGFFFSDKPVTCLEDAKKTDTTRFNKFFHEMLKKGIYLAPSAYEAGFVSTEHTDADIKNTLAAAEKIFQSWK